MPKYSKSELEKLGLKTLKELAERDGILPKGDKRKRDVWIDALLDPALLATRVPPPAKDDKDEPEDEALVGDPVGDALRDAMEATRDAMEALHIALEEHEESRRGGKGKGSTP